MSSPDALAAPARLRLPARTRSIPTDSLLLFGVIAVAIVIRVLTIDNQSIWADEALTAYETHLPFGAMLKTVVDFETTPPLYFVLIWGWAKLFGSGAIALRSFSAIGGVLLVGLAYACGREALSRRVGLLAAAFVAVNPLMVWYSQEARSYMLLALLTAAGFLCFLRAHRELSRRSLLWWTLLSALAVMTHFFAGFIIAPEALLLLWRWRERAIVLAIGLVVAVQLAMVPFAVADTTHGTAWIHGIPRITRIWEAVEEWGVGTLYRRGTAAQGLIGGAVFAALVALLLLLGGDRELRARVKAPGAIIAFVLLAPLLLGLLGPDFFLSRNAIPAFVPLAVVVAAACLAPRARLAGGLLALALLAVFSLATFRVQTNGYLQRPQWRDVARALGVASAPRAIVVAVGTTADPLKLYLPHVDWVQHQSTPQTVGEVDIVGVRNKRFSLPVPVRGGGVPGRPPRLVYAGDPVPREVAPPGTRLLARFQVHNWVIARFAFARPLRTTIEQLLARELEFFRHRPRQVLVFVQQPR